MNFIENTQTPNDVILATRDVSFLYTKIPQAEGIYVICRNYEHQYESNLRIPTNDLWDVMQLIQYDALFPRQPNFQTLRLYDSVYPKDTFERPVFTSLIAFVLFVTKICSIWVGRFKFSLR